MGFCVAKAPRNWAFLKERHGEPEDDIRVLGLVQFTAMSVLNNRWSHMHLDEIILDESLRVRGAGVGAWLLAKWVASQKDSTSPDTAPTDLSEREEVWLSKRSARVVQRSDGKFEPFVTLCVDESNANARRFYKKVGFTELRSSPDRCPDRIENVISMKTLQYSLRGLDEPQRAPSILGDADRRVRITYTGPELEELLFSTMRSRKSRFLFDEHDLAHARSLNDPAAVLTEILATFYFEHFRDEIEGFVRDANEPAALMPIGGKEVTFDVVRLFTLDRLLLWHEPRVSLSRDHWNAARARDLYLPGRTSSEEWATTRYMVLLRHT